MWKRFAAGVYDLLIVSALWLVTGAVALAATRGTLDGANWLFRSLLVFVTLGYFALSWQRGGQTIGARAWRLRVRAAEGRDLSARAAWLRASAMCLGALPAGLGTLIALLDRDRRALQDRVANSCVQQLPRD